VDRVRFERVSTRYVLGDRTNAREAITAAARRLVDRRRRPQQELWSLRDVSFSVADGEALGILGRNGAGKSTILKILTGITAPTNGVSRTRGRVAALLEVGTGFHQEPLRGPGAAPERGRPAAGRRGGRARRRRRLGDGA
jgi:ABC-type polysaccharide/polyol phosphate transport system ATPase subunit